MSSPVTGIEEEEEETTAPHMGAWRETARLAKVGTHFVVERAVAAFNAGDGDVDVVADAISLCFECVKMRAYNLWNADNLTKN